MGDIAWLVIVWEKQGGMLLLHTEPRHVAGAVSVVAKCVRNKNFAVCSSESVYRRACRFNGRLGIGGAAEPLRTE